MLMNADQEHQVYLEKVREARMAKVMGATGDVAWTGEAGSTSTTVQDHE